MAAGPIVTRNQAATVYVGGFDEKVSEEVLWELFLQAGRVVGIHLPKDRISQAHQGYGFVELFDEDDADYAVRIMNMIKLYGKPIRVNKASAHQKSLDIGANIFVGNLDPEVDEKLIYDTFSAFGVLLQVPKIVRDPSTGNSRGFCFLHYGSFEASDAAIAAMNQQHLCNRAVCVSYAYRRDAAAATDDRNRRHGSAAERLLAATNPLVKNCRPNQLFADAPPLPVVAPPPPPPPPTLLADSVAPPLVAAASGATGGFSFPGCPPPLIAVSQESAAVVAVPALPCALLPPPPPPPPPRSDVIKMEGADPPPLSHFPPPPTNLALQQVLQSTSLRLLTSYSPMKSMLPPPPPPPPPLHYSPMTSSMPPPPPPPPLQPSSSWNSYHFQPTMQEHINRFGGQMTPQHLMSARPQCPMAAPQHPMNMCPSPAERRTSFMQGERPLPAYWNEYQDSHRR